LKRPPANRFWRFSLRSWRLPGVHEACLALQERCGADVNLLLFCAWAGQAGRQLDRGALTRAIGQVGAWQSGVIAPLRLARRALKQQPEGSAAALLAPAFRKRLAALELDLERAEQGMLADLAAQWAPERASATARQAIAANLACYLGLLAKPAGHDELMHASRIAQACSPARARTRQRAGHSKQPIAPPTA